MPEPIEYRALRNLQTALQAMAVASGYYYTVTSVAVKLDPNHNIDAFIESQSGARPLVILEVLPDALKLAGFGSQFDVDLPITIHWISGAIANTDEALLRTYFEGCADVERAIAVDRSRGVEAADTLLTNRVFDRRVDESQVWARLDTLIKVTRTYGQPSV